MKPGMTHARLRELLDSYGAAPERWPAAEREAAQALLANDADAQRLQREAAELDGLLDVVPAHPPSAALRARVAEIPARSARGVAAWWSPRALWGMALAGAFVATLGVVSGAWLGADEGTSASGDENASASGEGTSASDDGWDDVTTVAFAGNLGEE
jgi:hypothetical protein